MSEDWKPREGQIVAARFRLLQYLGGSDHSAVFLTERGEEPKKAVIKLMPAPAENAEAQVLRWKLATKLPHPQLLKVFEAGQYELNHKALLYVVMEYAEENLAEVVAQRPLTADEARQMLLPALDALAYLHSKGFVHGGVKPSNILASGDQLKLSTDSIVAANDTNGLGGRSAGPYDSPEAKDEKLSPASDVWSLGITLAEILTQHRPTFDSNKKQEPALPKELEDPFRIFARNCLRVDPKSRWTVAEIKALLVPSAPPPKPAKATQATKLPAVLYYGPIVVLVGLVGFAMHRWSPHSSSVPTNQAIVESQKSAPPTSQVSSSRAKASAAASSAKAVSAPRAPSIPGAVLQQVLPDVPQKALATITGKVRVRVKARVDEAGNVTETTLDSPGPSKYFARLAQQAAEKWKFTPPRVNGHAVPSEWLLHFGFTASNMEATAKPATP
jgi:TonB family protein